MLSLTRACLALLSLLSQLHPSVSFHRPLLHRHLCMRRAPQPLCADNIGSSDPAQTGDEEVIYPVLPNPLDPDYIPMEGDTEEILDQMRAERQRDNDRWQSAVFRDQQSGVYTGSFELFVPRPAEGKFGLGLHSAGSVQMAVGSQNTPSTGIVASIEEKFSGHVADENFDWLFEGRAVKLEPTSLRLAAGNQAIGNAFTLGSAVDDQGRYLIEVGLKEGANRVRVKYAYVRQDTSAFLPNDEFQLGLAGVLVVRESLVQSSPLEMQHLLTPALGRQLYDPQEFTTDYHSIQLPGQLTLFFPRGLSDNVRSVVSLQWEGAVMMYQADRKAVDLTGSLKTLELTEISVGNAEAYPPITVIR